MTERPFSEEMQGKEVHVRLLSNDLLERGKPSLTVVGTGDSSKAFLKDSLLERKEYTQYPPPGLIGQLAKKISGNGHASKNPGVLVIVEEKHGSMSADDARYIEWLGQVKGEPPRVVMLPETGHGSHAEPVFVEHRHSFWKRQYRRLKAMPAPITKDAAIAAIPRTGIPVGFSIFLAYLKRHEVPIGRAGGYIGLAFGFAVGFALFNQTVLNYMTFWSELTREAFEPWVRSLHRWIDKREGRFTIAVARTLMNLLAFVSARGDVLIAGPLMGVGCVYLARLVLGPVGETVSVLTFYGFFLVLCNVIVGCIAGGPYTQVVAHLRAVGKISNRTSMYLGIVETVKMELGRLADFGMQTLFNTVQVALAVVFWLLLLLVDRCFPKPDVHCLERKEDIELVRRLFQHFRAREDVQQALRRT